jgi:hypothetical protein
MRALKALPRLGKGKEDRAQDEEVPAESEVVGRPAGFCIFQKVSPA